VAVGQLDGRAVVVSGSDDRAVRVWDAATSDPAGDPFTGHAGPVRSVAIGQLGGRTGSGDHQATLMSSLWLTGLTFSLGCGTGM
jgi:WD40 repeat protein